MFLSMPPRPAPRDLRAEAKRWARVLGIRRQPGVWLVPGRLSPLLWWLGGRPHLYLPSDLWPTLDGDQRTALLVHELAHLRRGDQWVRLLEMITTSLYWWNPILWLARHELREAEEQCCDAWVVWALPGAGRTYALALVETLDFLSETRAPLPVAASGLGQVRNLRRRLSMIMRGTTPRRLGWVSLLAVTGAAVLLLPLVPTLAQDSPRPAQEEEIRARRAQAEAALRQAEAELQKARADMEQARARAQQAERAARQQPERLANERQPQAYVVIIQDDQGREVRRIKAKPGQTIRVPGGDEAPEGGGRFGRDPRPDDGPPGAVGPGRPGNKMTDQPGAMMPPGQPKAGEPAAGGRGRGGMAGAGPGAGKPGGPPTSDAQERRFREIERRLDEIMRTMERMMRDQDRRQPQSDRSPTPRRESRAEEEDIKVRPGTRSRNRVDRDEPTPAGAKPSDTVPPGGLPPTPAPPKDAPADTRPAVPGAPPVGAVPAAPSAPKDAPPPGSQPGQVGPPRTE